MNKQDLRKHFIKMRSTITPIECQKLSYEIGENFFAVMDLSKIKVIHTFLPIEKNNEPNTWVIIDRIVRTFPHIKFSIPRINEETNDLESFYYEGKEKLILNDLGIAEPKEGKLTEAKDIDMVLVPLLTFDTAGHRVGYGKGFYDKFLNTCRKDCKKIGLSLFPTTSPIDDINVYDQKLNVVITPTKVFNF